jgi:hypothetical protein
MKAIAYYRSRPSEPAASDAALHIQRQAVQSAINEHGYVLVGEFIEREREGDEGWPAYVAAVQAALARRGDDEFMVSLLIASHAGIGAGEPFRAPSVEGANEILHVGLGAKFVRAATEIALPPDALGPLCLYAEFRPSQLDTLVYLCNGGVDALASVTAVIDNISMSQFYDSDLANCWDTIETTDKKQWKSIAPRTCVLINTLRHEIWDVVNRYRLTFTNSAGHEQMASTDDHALNACRLVYNPDPVWVCFDRAHVADSAGPREETEEFHDGAT